MEREGYSSLSITSFVFSILGFLFLLAWTYAAMINAAEMTIGFLIMIQWTMNLIGLGTGIPSLFTNSKKRLFGILSVVSSTSTGLITLSMVLIGLSISS